MAATGRLAGDSTFPCRSSDSRRLDLLEAGEFTQLGECAGPHLADAFLADPQFLADLRQRQLWDTSDPVSAHEDPALTLLKLTKPAHRRRPGAGSALLRNSCSFTLRSGAARNFSAKENG